MDEAYRQGGFISAAAGSWAGLRSTAWPIGGYRTTAPNIASVRAGS